MAEAKNCKFQYERLGFPLQNVKAGHRKKRWRGRMAYRRRGLEEEKDLHVDRQVLSHDRFELPLANVPLRIAQRPAEPPNRS